MARLLRTEWPLAVVLAAGAALRVLTSVAYRPAMAFLQDSYDYLGDASRLRPGVIRPLGYPLFLRLLSAGGRLELVPLVQHLLGLGAGVALYLVLRHVGVGRGVAALGAAPVLLDGYQVYLEHFVMAEALFAALVVAAVVLLLGPDRPGAPACAAAGAVLAAAALTRSVGLLLLPVGLGYLAARRVGVRRLALAAGTAAAVLMAYAGWFAAAHGRVALEAYSGYFLAGKVEPFADCGHLRLPDDERPLCDARPPGERPSTDWYVWSPDAPLRRLDAAAVGDRNALAGRFGRRVVLHQPGAYLRAVARDLVHYLAPGRTTGATDFPAQAWQFRVDFSPDPWHPMVPPADPYAGGWSWPGPSVAHGVTVAAHGFGLEQVRPALHRPAASALARYQRLGFTDGPVLLGGLLLGLLAGLGPLGDARRRRLRHAGAFLGGAGAAVLLGPAALSVFDVRYVLPALVLLPPGGAVGLTLLLDRRRAARG